MLDILPGKRPLRRALLVGLVLTGLLAAAGARPGLAHSPDKLRSGFGTPTIDGVWEPGEWAVAAEVPVFPSVLPGSSLLVMNDAENVYIAASVTDPTLSGSDFLQIRFDNEHNGVVDDGDDNLSLGESSSLYDGHYEAAEGGWAAPDAVSNGVGAVAHAGGVNFFEISHPLNSGDLEDIAVAPRESLGICAIYFQDGSGGSHRTFPPDCHLAVNAQTLYADLDLAALTGDLDCDGDADAVDAALVLQFDAGLPMELPLCASPDAYHDGAVDAVDALVILQYVAGLVPSLPVG